MASGHPQQGVPIGRGKRSAQIREQQQHMQRYAVRPGAGRATSHTTKGTFLTSKKRPTQRGNAVPSEVKQVNYWS